MKIYLDTSVILVYLFGQYTEPESVLLFQHTLESSVSSMNQIKTILCSFIEFLGTIHIPFFIPLHQG